MEVLLVLLILSILLNIFFGIVALRQKILVIEVASKAKKLLKKDTEIQEKYKLLEQKKEELETKVNRETKELEKKKEDVSELEKAFKERVDSAFNSLVDVSNGMKIESRDLFSEKLLDFMYSGKFFEQIKIEDWKLSNFKRHPGKNSYSLYTGDVEVDLDGAKLWMSMNGADDDIVKFTDNNGNIFLEFTSNTIPQTYFKHLHMAMHNTFFKIVDYNQTKGMDEGLLKLFGTLNKGKTE